MLDCLATADGSSSASRSGPRARVGVGYGVLVPGGRVVRTRPADHASSEGSGGHMARVRAVAPPALLASMRDGDVIFVCLGLGLGPLGLTNRGEGPIAFALLVLVVAILELADKKRSVSVHFLYR